MRLADFPVRILFSSALAGAIAALAAPGCGEPDTPCMVGCRIAFQCDGIESPDGCDDSCKVWEKDPCMSDYFDCVVAEGTCDSQSICGDIIDNALRCGECEENPGTCGSAIESLPVTHNDTPCKPAIIHKQPGEARLWLAARLTPPSYPFEVERVRGVLVGGLQGDGLRCRTDLRSGLHFLVSASTEPSVSQLSVLGETTDTIQTTGVGVIEATPRVPVIFEPTEPLVLQQGEHLFVIFDDNGSFPDVLCVGACEDETFQADRNFYSATEDFPASWSSLEERGTRFNLRVSMSGHPL